MSEKKENKESVFNNLFALNVNDYVETKGDHGLKYLSWANAWAEVAKRYPDASYSVREWDGKPYLHDEILGYLVETSVTIEGKTLTMRLPVMDNNNKAQKHVNYTYTVTSGQKEVKAATMFDINTAIMRCFVKNLGMFGLGLYIYSGEDLPQGEKEEIDKLKPQAYEELLTLKTKEEVEAFAVKYKSICDVDTTFKNKVNNKLNSFNGVSF